MRFFTIIRFSIAVLVFVFAPRVQAQQVLDDPVWTITPADVDWLSSVSTVRGGVVNPATGDLLIPSREEPLSIQVLDPATGTVTGQMDVTGVAGGTFPINKIAATSDGQVFASNLVLDASTANLKIYRWADQTSSPTVAFDATVSAHRYGDAFNVSGSGGDVVAYASGSASNPNVAVFEMGAGSFAAPSLIAIPAGAAQTGVVKAAGQDSLWINNPVGAPVRKISAVTGEIGTVIPTELVHGYLGELAEFTLDGRTYLAVGPGRHDEDAINESRVLLLDVTDIDDIEIVAQTHRWGDTDNRFAPGGFVTYDEVNNLLIAGVTQNPIQAFSLEFLVAPEVITIADARSLGIGATVTVEGTVSRAMGTFTYFQDDTGGLTIRQTSGRPFHTDVADGTITSGTQLQVTGMLSAFQSLLQFNEGDLAEYMIMGQDDELEPLLFTLEQIEEAEADDVQARLVEVRDLSMDLEASPPHEQFAAATTYFVTDASITPDNFQIRIPNAADTEVDGMDIPDEDELFTFTGVVGWFGQAQLLAILASDIEIQDVGTDDGATSLVFGLEQNYPNPFTGSTTIGFSLAEPADVDVSVYDLTGRRVAILVEGELQAGSHTTTWRADGLASGVYFYRIQAGSFTQTLRALIVR